METETRRPQAGAAVQEEEGRGVIAHIVLLQPKPDLTEQQRADALRTIETSAATLPDIRSLRLGRRVKHGLPGYEQLMTQEFEYALIVEADDVEALKRYLQAPAHEALAHLFYTATSAALAYDYVFD
jgi:Stress responsive A/B Barrel Domain